MSTAARPADRLDRAAGQSAIGSPRRCIAFAQTEGIPWVDFAKGQRKDDVMQERPKHFTPAEGVVFIGRAQERNTVFRTEKRHHDDGTAYPWIVKSTGVINQFYLLTETTINDSMDFEIRKGLVNLPALREIGLRANRRLLGVQRLDHDPITGTHDLHTVTDPITTGTGTRVSGLRLGRNAATPCSRRC